MKTIANTKYYNKQKAKHYTEEQIKTLAEYRKPAAQ